MIIKQGSIRVKGGRPYNFGRMVVRNEYRAEDFLEIVSLAVS